MSSADSVGNGGLVACCRRLDAGRTAVAEAVSALRRAVALRSACHAAAETHELPFVFDPSSADEEAASSPSFGAPVYSALTEPVGPLGTVSLPVARTLMAAAENDIHALIVGVQPLAAVYQRETRGIEKAVAALANEEARLVMLRLAAVPATTSNESTVDAEDIAELEKCQRDLAAARASLGLASRQSLRLDRALLELRPRLANVMDEAGNEAAIAALADATAQGALETLLLRDGIDEAR